MNIFDLTAHQLDVLRTLASFVGAAGTFIVAINTVYSVLGKKWAKKAATQTETTEWVDGHLIYVADPNSRAHRHRLPTSEIPTRRNNE